MRDYTQNVISNIFKLNPDIKDVRLAGEGDTTEVSITNALKFLSHHTKRINFQKHSLPLINLLIDTVYNLDFDQRDLDIIIDIKKKLVDLEEDIGDSVEVIEKLYASSDNLVSRSDREIDQQLDEKDRASDINKFLGEIL